MVSKTCSYSSAEIVASQRAASNDKEEQAPHFGSDFTNDVGDAIELVHVALRDGGLGRVSSPIF